MDLTAEKSLAPVQRLRLSGMNFLSFAAFSAILPNLALYYTSLGFSGAQIGLILGVGPLLSLFATPFWAGLADAKNRHREILIGGVLALILIYGSIPLLRSFPQIIVAVILLALLSSHVLALQDSATMHMLGNQLNRYGRIRLWGTIGWGVGALLFGALLNQFGLVWMFWIYSFLMLINLFIVRHLEFDKNAETKSFFVGIKALLSSPRWLLFFLMVFLSAIGLSAHGSYLSLLLDSLPSSTFFGFYFPVVFAVGAALFASTLFELPVMFFSTTLFRWFGNRELFIIAMLTIGLRNTLYAFVSTPAQVLAVQVLHGFTYALLWLGGINFVAQNAPPGLRATAQGLFSTVLIGFGFAAGNFINGSLIDIIGVAGMFLVTGAVVFSGLLLVLLLDKRFVVFGPAKPS